jgi:hypothetical protein
VENRHAFLEKTGTATWIQLDILFIFDLTMKVLARSMPIRRESWDRLTIFI